MSKTIYRERAERGEKVLDALYGPDWHWDEEFDNLKTLKIRSGEQCMGGKLECEAALPGRPGYFVMCDKAREAGLMTFTGKDSPKEHGFVEDLGWHHKGRQDKAWCDIITERRQNALYGLETGLEGVRTDEGFERAQAATSLA